MRRKTTRRLSLVAIVLVSVCLVVAALYCHVWQVRVIAASEARHLGTASLPLYRRLLADEEPEVRAVAASQVGWLGPAALPLLRGALQYDEYKVRRHAVWGLTNKSMDGTGVPELLRVLRTDNWEGIRLEAASALGFLREAAKDAVPELIESLRDPEADVRAAAAVALGLMVANTEPALLALKDCLHDPNWKVRVAAATAVGAAVYAATPSVEKALVELLRRDPIAKVRASAARSLGNINSSAVAELKVALEDPAVEVRHAAALALADLFSNEQHSPQ
jgi:HEAT repeat protein